VTANAGFKPAAAFDSAMTTQPCDVCGRKVRIAGGIGDFWSFATGSGSGATGGIDLELADGSEWFVCLDCIDDLPGDREVTGEDVRDLRRDVNT
jgi:hypothetical protein